MKKDGHYRLPLKLINSYLWAGLEKPTQATLPVVGCYVSQYNIGACSLPRGKMAEYTGYSNLAQTIDPALNELVIKYLVIKKKAWRINRYYLTDLSKCGERRSYFPLYKYQIEGGYWAKLKPCEKTVYPVLGLKGVVNNPEVVDNPEICCRGQIKKKKDFCKWTGLNYSSFERTLRGLEDKSLLAFNEDGTYDLYKLEMMRITK